MDIFARASNVLSSSSPVVSEGIVTDVIGLIIEGNGPSVGIGTTCEIKFADKVIPAEVVGFRKERILLMPLADTSGLCPGAKITSRGLGVTVQVSRELLGRVIDPLGRPLDGKPLPMMVDEVPLYQTSPQPLSRKRVEDVLDVGIKAINGLITVGRGQRIAIMAGSGVGKSTFLGMIAKHALSEINIIALVGERGREVREFIEKDLGPEGLARSIVVVATSDSSALMRIRAALMATSLAEYFRDQGCQTTLMVDSITRFCMAQREIGLAVGEPPTTAGYTPSVFAMLPKLLERAGNNQGTGSITGFYTVLVEGDDMNEPIADAVRGIVDGHVVLSRALASKGQYPAIDVLQSLSRVMSDIVPREQSDLARKIKEIVARYREVEDLITIGAYKPGQNAQVDFAVSRIEAVLKFLTQRPEERVPLEECVRVIGEIINGNAPLNNSVING